MIVPAFAGQNPFGTRENLWHEPFGAKPALACVLLHLYQTQHEALSPESEFSGGSAADGNRINDDLRRD